MVEIFMTVKHRTGVGFDEPLHVRERSYRYAWSAIGHAVCLMDWAALLEFEMERCSRSIAGPFTAYPHGIDAPLFGFMTHADAVYAFGPSVGEWIDPSWTPDPEGEWTETPFRHNAPGLSLVAPRMTTRRLRSLDDLRRHYYDVRRCTRLDMGPYATISLTGPHPGGYNSYGIDQNGESYSYEDTTGGTVAVDFAQRFHADVVADPRFSGTAKWVAGIYNVHGSARGHSDDSTFDEHKIVWLPVEGATIDLSAAKPSACHAVLEEVMGRHPVHADGSYYCSFSFLTNSSYRRAVICDVEFPSDSEFIGWRWEPEENQEDEQ